MDLELAGKVYLVSGGSRGIGEAITETLAAEGAIAVTASRNAAANVALVARLTDAGQAASAIDAELSDADSCARVIAACLERHGRLDGLVNNAGVNDGVGLEHGADRFERSLLGNLAHYYYLAHYALPHLRRAGGAAIVNVSSKTALTGQGGTSGYAAAKGAQLALTREWAVELAPYGIRVNAVVPAEVMTPLYRAWLARADDPAAKQAAIEARIPLGRRMTAAGEIAAQVAFLLSPRSGHTTGQWLHADGGYVHLDRAL